MSVRDYEMAWGNPHQVGKHSAPISPRKSNQPFGLEGGGDGIVPELGAGIYGSIPAFMRHGGTTPGSAGIMIPMGTLASGSHGYGPPSLPAPAIGPSGGNLDQWEKYWEELQRRGGYGGPQSGVHVGGNPGGFRVT